MTAAQSKASEPLFDCDVRVTWRSTSELLPYLPRVWQDRVRAGRGVPRIQPAFYLPQRGFNKEAATPDAKSPPGSDPQTLRSFFSTWVARLAPNT